MLTVLPRINICVVPHLLNVTTTSRTLRTPAILSFPHSESPPMTELLLPSRLLFLFPHRRVIWPQKNQSHDIFSYQGISRGTFRVRTHVPYRLVHYARDLSRKELEPVPEHRCRLIQRTFRATPWHKGRVLSPHHAARHARLRLLFVSWHVQRLDRSRWWWTSKCHDVCEFDMRTLCRIRFLCVLFWVIVHSSL